MIEKIIEASVRNKPFVIILLSALVAGGVLAMLNIPLAKVLSSQPVRFR